MTRPILDLGSWCILRCSSSKTLELAKSLGEAGFGIVRAGGRNQ